MREVENLARELRSAFRLNANLAAGRSRRRLIALAASKGRNGWPQWLCRAVEDERGNMLPVGGYADEDENR